MTESAIDIDRGMLYARSILKIIREKDSTLAEIYSEFIKTHPRSFLNKVFHPPADIKTVDAYVKSITNKEFIVQLPAELNETSKVQVIRYHITKKGLSFLGGKRK